MIVQPIARRIHIPTVHFPRQAVTSGTLDGNNTSTHGFVVYGNFSTLLGVQWYYIYQYFATPADIARYILIDQTFIAPPADINTTGWNWNFLYKPKIIDKLNAVQFAAL